MDAGSGGLKKAAPNKYAFLSKRSDRSSDVLFIESRHLRWLQALFSTETRSFYGFEVNFRLEFSFFVEVSSPRLLAWIEFCVLVENCSWRMHGVVAAPDAAPASRAPVEAGKWYQSTTLARGRVGEICWLPV